MDSSKLLLYIVLMIVGVVLLMEYFSENICGKHNENFSAVSGLDKPLFRLYFAKWCGHCKNLKKQEWPKFLNNVYPKYKGKFTVDEIDADEHEEICKQNGIEGFPTLKLYMPDGKVYDYGGDRTADDFEQFLKNKLKL